MSEQLKRRDEATRQVESSLSSALKGAAVEAYRLEHPWATIRVRVLSEQFKGLSRVGREELVDPILQTLPDEVQSDVIMLLLLTPEEYASRAERGDILAVEFDHPVRASY